MGYSRAVRKLSDKNKLRWKISCQISFNYVQVKYLFIWNSLHSSGKITSWSGSRASTAGWSSSMCPVTTSGGQISYYTTSMLTSLITQRNPSTCPVTTSGGQISYYTTSRLTSLITKRKLHVSSDHIWRRDIVLLWQVGSLFTFLNESCTWSHLAARYRTTLTSRLTFYFPKWKLHMITPGGQISYYRYVTSFIISWKMAAPIMQLHKWPQLETEICSASGLSSLLFTEEESCTCSMATSGGHLTYCTTSSMTSFTKAAHSRHPHLADRICTKQV